MEKVIWFVNKYCTWPILRHLGTNPAVRSANIWALVVPIVAKLLDRVQDLVTVELFGQKFMIQLSLPFSWKVFFFAAVVFWLANIVYSIFCPSLIKETMSYRDFVEQRRSRTELSTQFQEIDGAGLLDNGNGHLINWLTQSCAGIAIPNISNELSLENQELALSESYAIIVTALARVHPRARFCASFLYLVGMLALGLIAVQNIIFVVGH